MKDLTVLQAKRFGTIFCNDQTTLIEAAKIMVGEDISGLVVQDHLGYLAGIITRSDVLRAHLECQDWASQPVQTFMTREVIYVQPNEKLVRVAELLLEKGIHRIVIVQKDHDHLRPIGVISDGDLMYHMIREPMNDPQA